MNLVLRLVIAATLLVACHRAALATACQFETQGEGRVAEIVDARSIRLDDGREVRLLGIEPAATTKQALTDTLAGREVNLGAGDDTPERYGRQPALIFVGASDISVQSQFAGAGRRHRIGRNFRQGVRGRPAGVGSRGAVRKKGQLG